MNRLRDATSPYLLQHADNPVDWWPWCEEAFADARRRGIPVLLSIGYSACHWCHVMAHESFEDPATAALLNEHLVAIKVDREERPDVDAVYMSATTALTGHGGWPMTVFMTAEREPFYCGTYFPRDTFQRLVRAVAKAWDEDRDSVVGQARKISQILSERASASVTALRDAGPGPVTEGLDRLAEAAAPDPAGPVAERLASACATAVDVLESAFDAARGGFGGAPKFPPSMVLEFLLREHARLAGPAPGEAAGSRAQQMAAQTMAAMARGGIYDQLGGGFARYSVDAAWVVPHFEKMLYDNALLARDYVHLWRQTCSPLARRVAEQTCDWMVRELRTPQGGLASALDADSEGEEGKFYVWTPRELTAVLGAGDGEFAAETFGVTSSGTFEHGRSVLQLRADPADGARLDRVRAALFAARQKRVRPGRDDKVVAAWNGMAIAALAETGLLLGRPDLIAAAADAAGLLARVHIHPDIPPQATPPQATPPQATPPQATPPQATPPQATPPPPPGAALSELHDRRRVLRTGTHKTSHRSSSPRGGSGVSEAGGTDVVPDETYEGGEVGGEPVGGGAGPGGGGGAGPGGGGGAGAGGVRLVRTSRDGVAGESAGLLEDYACVAEGFLVLSGVTGEPRWLDLAGRLLDTALARFTDGRGGFFDTPDDGEELLYRPADPADNATPSGAFAAAGALLGYAAVTGSARHREAAVAALGPLPAIAGRYPQAAGSGLSVAEALLSGPAEIAIVGPPGDPRTAALHVAALRAAPPGAVIALGDGTAETGIALLAGRGLVNGEPAAYVCRNFACRAPVTEPAALVAVLSAKE